MKKELIIGLVLLVLCNMLSAQAQDSVKYLLLRPEEFQQAYNKEDKAVLIDVREFFEYRKSRLKNALNFPVSDNFKIAADTLLKENAVFLYCSSGFRSKRVAKFFCDRGFVKVYSLDGGINAWKKDGLTMEKKRIRR